MPCKKASWFNSLALKILAAYIAGALLSIGLMLAFGAIVQDRLPGMSMMDRAHNFASQLRFDNNGMPVGFKGNSEHPSWLYDSLSNETAYRVLDASGHVVLASAGAKNWPPQTELTQRRFALRLNGVLYDGASVPVQKEGKTWFVQLTVSSQIIEFLHQGFALPFIKQGVITFSLVLLVVFGACAYITLAYSLRPLRKASVAAAHITPQSLDGRLDVDRVPAEIMPLIYSFNQTLNRLETGFKSQQAFLAKAAHELKTPLTLIRAEVELFEGDISFQEQLLAHINHLSRHVQQLLILAEVSEPLGYKPAGVNVNEAVQDAIAYLEKIALEADVDIVINSKHDMIIWRSDRGAFFTLLKNIIENAIQHAPPGTPVFIDIDRDNISVRDFGPGVAHEQLDILFTRFWRGAHRRDHGAGLGLAICQEIANAHGWTIVAENALPGLMITVRRPDLTEHESAVIRN